MNYRMQISQISRKTQKMFLGQIFVMEYLLKKMKQVFLCLISFILICCSSVYSSQRISVTSFGNYWKVSVGYYAQISITPQETLTNMSRTVIVWGLSDAITDNNGTDCKKNVLNSKKNIVQLNFSSLADERTQDYTFNNAQVYMIKNGKRYNLQPVDSQNNNIAQATLSINNGLRRNHYFRLPLVCSELNDAIFEISGIYKNGVNYPSIQFKIHLIR